MKRGRKLDGMTMKQRNIIEHVINALKSVTDSNEALLAAGYCSAKLERVVELDDEIEDGE